MSNHFREECRHGTTVGQCRCRGPKSVRIAACPANCKERYADPVCDYIERTVESTVDEPIEANDVDRTAEAILVAHQRFSFEACLCGWSELGKSHPRHQVAMLRKAGVLNPEPSPVPTRLRSSPAPPAGFVTRSSPAPTGFITLRR